MPLRLVPRSMTLDDLGELLTVKLSKYLKKRMVKVLVWSVALYASETWTVRNDDTKRLEAFEMWIWLKIEKISWTEHVTNDQVLTMVRKQRSLMDTIRKRQRNWIGHNTQRKFITENSTGREKSKAEEQGESQDENA